MKIDYSNLPKHIAIIMDGNRRWAKENELTTKEGHKKGAKNLEEISEFCNEIGIKYLTVYAFSTENWKRSKQEVSTIMFILKAHLDSFNKKNENKNIKVNILGDISVLAKSIQDSLLKSVEKTKNNTGLVLNIALNYGGRSEIINAVKKIAQMVKKNKIEIEDINEQLISDNLYTQGQPDPDLLIRPSAEFRLSNFLTWQSIYSELYFPKKYWPEFSKEDLLEAIKEYQKRNRRFGGRPEEANS